jgi:hypothetical protein
VKARVELAQSAPVGGAALAPRAVHGLDRGFELEPAELLALPGVPVDDS